MPDALPNAPLLRPGHNCWRVEPCQRFSMLVDADAYFSALREALAKATHSVFILGWDIDSRMVMTPGGGDHADGLPPTLRDFLNALCKRQRGLRIYVLSWDFAMVFALEREWLPSAKMHWQTHRRLSFRLGRLRRSKVFEAPMPAAARCSASLGPADTRPARQLPFTEFMWSLRA